MEKKNNVRVFETGATRSSSNNKPDYEGYMSPVVMAEYGKYMLKHQVQENGELRDSDNWQKGMPVDEYFKSGFRHWHKSWSKWRGYKMTDEKGKQVELRDELMAMKFNIDGIIHELYKHEYM